MHTSTAGPICMSHYTPRDAACIASVNYAMVMRTFRPVFCISVSIAKGIMKSTLNFDENTTDGWKCIPEQPLQSVPLDSDICMDNHAEHVNT